MVTLYHVKNLRYGHAEVCFADRSHAILLKIFIATLLARLPAAG
jgi:hypothetical protein